MSKVISREERLRGLLGIAMRAGRLITGADTVLNTVRAGKAQLVLADEAASENTLKKVKDACIYHHAAIMYLPQGLLESATGRDGRMLGVLTDQGFARKIQEIMAEDRQASADA